MLNSSSGNTGNENVRKRFLRTYFLVVDIKGRQCLHEIRDSLMDINDTEIFAFLIAEDNIQPVVASKIEKVPRDIRSA